MLLDGIGEQAAKVSSSAARRPRFTWSRVALPFLAGPRSVGILAAARARSSAGRARESHSRGQGFESPRVHQSVQAKNVPQVIREVEGRGCSAVLELEGVAAGVETLNVRTPRVADGVGLKG